MDTQQGLKRTLSSSNVTAAEQIHNFIKIQQDALQGQIPQLNRDVTKSSMILPEQYSANTLRLCVDLKHLDELEREHYLNWCTDCRLVLPLEVEDDGNSLLHSLSVYMFGVQDRRCVLRQLLYQRLFMEGPKGLLKQRWMVKDNTRSGLFWNNIVEMASDKVLSSHEKFADLNSIHIFTMANILARPIIVSCDTNIQHQELSVGGIYLPLLRNIKECEKSPIILGYKNGHFVPLVSSENLMVPLCNNMPSEDAQHCVPLVDYDFNDLPLNFLLPGEELGDHPINMRNTYLDVINISHRTANYQRLIPAAMLKFKTPPAFSIELMWSLEQLTLRCTDESAGNETGHIYTALNELDNNDVYESLLPCAEKINGCANNASSNNHKGLCIDCYKKILAHQNARLICSRKLLGCNNFAENNSQNMCAFCYEGFLAAQGATKKRINSVPRVAVKKCTMPYCNNAGLPGFNGQCQTCISLEQNYNDRAVDINDTEDNTYNALNNFNSDQNNCVDIGSNYDQLNVDNVIKNRPLPSVPVAAARGSYYEQPLPFKGTPYRQKNDDNGQGDNRREDCLINANDNMVQGAGSNYPIVTSNTTYLQHAAAAYVPAAGPTDSIRSKVLCDIAGCTNSIGEDGKHCNMHNPQRTQPNYKTCVMKSCSNTAEFNDHYLCMVCFQSQKHVVRETKVLDHTGSNPGGSFDLKSIVNELPPMPMPSPSPVQPTADPQFSGQPPQIGYKNLNTPLNFTNLPNIPNMPNMPNMPYVPNNLGMLPNTQGPVGRPRFTPPMSYGGFETFDKQFATQNATLNWQKGGIGTKQLNDPRKCLHCDNHANPAKEGLCNECYRQKEVGIKQTEVTHDEGLKCINDGCKKVGMERFNFLCESCCLEQLQALKSDVQQKQQEQIPIGNMDNPQNFRDFSAGNVNYPQIYHGGVNTAHGLNTNKQSQQPQVHSGNIDRNFYSGNVAGVQGNHGLVSTSIASPFSATINPIGPNVNTVYHTPVPPANIGMQKCTGLSCDFFGSEEYGGYCYGCFLNITKKEAEKQEAARTYAPPDVNATPPTPGVTGSPRCRGYQCPNYGSNQRMGYCSQCFQMYAERERPNVPSV